MVAGWTMNPSMAAFLRALLGCSPVFGSNPTDIYNDTIRSSLLPLATTTTINIIPLPYFATLPLPPAFVPSALDIATEPALLPGTIAIEVKTKRTWTSATMQQAVAFYRTANANNRSFADTAALFNVKAPTLHKWFHATEPIRAVGRPPRLTKKDEESLYAWVCHRSNANQPISPAMLQHAASRLAEIRGVLLTTDHKYFGARWRRGFIRRNGDLVLRTARRVLRLMPTRTQFDGWFRKWKVRA